MNIKLDDAESRFDGPAVRNEESPPPDTSQRPFARDVFNYGSDTWPLRGSSETLPRYSYVLQKALAYIEAHWQKPLYVSDVCMAAATSERNLQVAFQRELRTTPMKYLRFRRLAAAKEMLTSSSLTPNKVKVAALTTGFRDLGRFSSEYRAAFGEAPSATLQRHNGMAGGDRGTRSLAQAPKVCGA